MSTQIQRRRGTTSEHSSFTGAAGEITIDSTKNTIVVHDGSTQGGIPLAKESALVSTVGALTDVTISSIGAGEILKYSGSGWINNTLSEAGIQPFDADTAKLDATTSNFTGTLQNGGSNVVVDTDIGATVQGYDVNLPVWPASVDATEVGYLNGVTSGIQTQLDAKQALDAELTELATMASTTASALADLTQAEVQILDGATVSTAELNKLVGYTGAVADLNRTDVTTEGLSEASKVVTADSNGVVSFDNGTVEESTAITSSSNAATINLRDGNVFTHTLSENVTYTFSNPAASGRASAFILKITQDSSARTITWPSSVDWAGATAPTITATSAGVDVFGFMTVDGGTTYYGFTLGQALG